MKATEQLKLQEGYSSEEKNQINLVSFKRHEIKDTPFDIIEKDDVFTIVIGDQIVSDEKFVELKKAKNHIAKKPWKLITVTNMILTERYLKIKMNEEIKNQSNSNS